MLRGISLFVATAFTVTTLISGPVEARAVSEIFVRADGIKADRATKAEAEQPLREQEIVHKREVAQFERQIAAKVAEIAELRMALRTAHSWGIT